MESVALKKRCAQLKWHKRIIHHVHFNGQQPA